MKKISAFTLALLLAFSLFVSCGKNGGGNTNGANDSAKQPAKQALKEIKPSELITLGDAERILGKDMQAIDADITDSNGDISALYGALGGDLESVNIVRRDGSSFAETINENDTDATIVTEIGDWACIAVNEYDFGVTYLYIDHSGYHIKISLTSDPFNDLRSAEENAARTTEKLKEFGKLAVERIDAIIN